MTEKIVRFGEVELATEAFGEPSDPPVLLIMGMMASMLWWPEAFCTRLAGEGRFVIRYDNRDTGLSTTYAPGEPGYNFDDMADDAIRVLDAYGLKAAHIVGMSMGGMLAQLVALKHAERVLSLTVLSSSPVGVDTSGLPGMTEAYREHSAKGETVDWSQRGQVIDFVVADMAAIASTKHPHDAVAARANVERDYDRARNFQSATNHFMVVGSGETPSIRDLTAPLLVIHGTTDPLFPVEHGEALAGAADDSTLLRVEGGGHELHEGDWQQIIAAIIEHTKR